MDGRFSPTRFGLDTQGRIPLYSWPPKANYYRLISSLIYTSAMEIAWTGLTMKPFERLKENEP